MPEKSPGRTLKSLFILIYQLKSTGPVPRLLPQLAATRQTRAAPFFAADQSSQPGAILDVEKVDPAEIETKPDLLASLELTLSADLGNKQILRPV